MRTPLRITYKSTETSPAFDALIHERADRLERLHPRITGCRVVVEVPYRKSGTGKVALAVDVEVDVPSRNTVVGKDVEARREKKEDHTITINRAFDAVERQLSKITEVLRDREAKNHEAAGESGVVVRVFPEEGYGSIEVRDSPELTFTRNAVVGDLFDELEVGMVVHVTRATTEGPMGPQARSVRLLGRAKSAS
ncbi:MAG: HPF/RaiA family ribosome-associated protein [Hyphomicrobiaceae bacterium]|nr:HPF/RaiA family ribosome-associated protein [Hyphomicrobiaceae bacterium]